MADLAGAKLRIHLRKLIATLIRENGQRDAIIDKLEDRLNELKPKPGTV